MVDIMQGDVRIDCVYLDLKKAFNRMPFTRLLWKLETLGGVNGKVTEMDGKLFDKKTDESSFKRQIVDMEINDKWCASKSVMASIMFLLCVNDMPNRL